MLCLCLNANNNAMVRKDDSSTINMKMVVSFKSLVFLNGQRFSPYFHYTLTSLSSSSWPPPQTSTSVSKYQPRWPSSSLSGCTGGSWGAIDFLRRWHLLCCALSHCLNHRTGRSPPNRSRCQTLQPRDDLLKLLLLRLGSGQQRSQPKATCIHPSVQVNKAPLAFLHF